jgi:hypothetical protein
MAPRDPVITYGTGPLGTAGNLGVAAGQRKYDIGTQIHDLEPNKNPLILLTSKIGKEKATDPVFKHFEDERLPRWIQVNGALADNATEVTVDDPGGSYVRGGDLLLVPSTGEVLKVASVTNATTVVVGRSFGPTAAAAIPDNERLMILGPVSAEAATSRAILTSKPGTVTNYCQIFRNPYGVTGTMKATQLWTPSQLAEEERKAAIEHSVDMERAFLFGEPMEDTTGDYPVRATGGLRYWIQTNIQTVNGDLTWDAFNQFMRTVFRYGGTSKILICSPILLGAIQRVASGNIQITPSEKSYGLNISQWVSPWGKLFFLNHWLLDDYYNTNGWGFCIDPSQIKYKVLRETQMRPNIQANDADQQKNEFLTEVGLKVIQEKSMGIIKGVTG